MVFAKHFMKNREETTCLHYNLLSNQRHAISIAMKLYDSFTDKSSNLISLKKKDSSDLSNDIEHMSKSVTKDDVISWLKKHDANLPELELKNIKEILGELIVDDQQTSGIPKEMFYSKASQEKVNIIIQCSSNL